MENKTTDNWYTYDTDCIGNITIYDPDGKDIAYLQGSDDVEIIENQVKELEKIWFRKFGKGYRKKFGPFSSYEEHLSYILSQYDID
jgi:hypothetical protein